MSPVHHMVLYECAEDDDKHLWNGWAEGEGYFGPNRPSAWATCATPLAAWAIGSQGVWMIAFRFGKLFVTSSCLNG